MKISYNWLQDYFDDKLPSVQELERLFMMHAYEVDGVEEIEIDGERDWIIDLDVLPNRAHDSLSHRGVAKELSVLTGMKVKKDELSNVVKDFNRHTDEISVHVSDHKLCARYVAVLIKGVKVGGSPAWLKRRLLAMGQKSINNVVDITNYVLFGIGQPTHVFDAGKFVRNNGIKLGIRSARNAEKVTVLGGDEYELSEEITVVTDANADAPVAIAGIKGGMTAEVDEDTVDIIVESAKFNPVKTRRAGAQLKLRTDASHRFENEISDRLPIYGAVEVSRLILDIAEGHIEGIADTNPEADTKENESVSINLSDLNAFLGSDISVNEAENILSRFEWRYSIEGERITVTPPFERLDINIPEDVYEEIGRVHGFENIVGKPLPENPAGTFINKNRAYEELVRKVMIDLSVPEIMTYTLTDKGDVKLVSVLNMEKSHIRANLRDGIERVLDKAEKNAPLLGEYEMIKTFEVGKVFSHIENEGLIEQTNVAIGVRALRKKKRASIQDEFLAIAQSALEKELGSELQGVEICDGILEFNLTKTIKGLPVPDSYPKLPLIDRDITYSPISSFPFVLRDIAAWAQNKDDEKKMREIIAKHGGALARRIDKFDEFEKDGRISIAFHIVFQSIDKTLTDEEVGDIMEKIEKDYIANGFEVR